MTGMADDDTSSIILTHWNAGVFRTAALPYLMPELVIYSLLYDEVLIREEDLLTNRRVMRMLRDVETFAIFEELLVAGFVKLLRLPLKFYPENRRHSPARFPVSARLEEHEARRSYKGRRFRATSWEWDLAAKLDRIVREHKQASKFHARFPSTNPFARQLGYLLGNLKRYRHPILRYIHPRTAETFVEFCEDPERWRRFLFDRGVKDPIIGPDAGFYRSAAYQCSEHLPTRRAIRRVVESVYAATYCYREGAAGHYGGSELVELPQHFNSDAEWNHADEILTNVEIVSTRAATSIAVDRGIAEIIGRTRTSSAFTQLRSVIRSLETAPSEALLPTEAAFKDAWGSLAAAYADAAAAVWAMRSPVVQRISKYAVYAFKLAGILGFQIVRELPIMIDLAKAADEAVEYSIHRYSPAVLRSVRAVGETPSLRENLIASTAVRCSKVVLSSVH